MTGQTLLDYMEILNQELQLQSGESDVTRGLLALNIAQDYFESLASARKVMANSTGTVTTSAGTESTTFPAGLLRVDSLWVLDENSLPKRELDPLQRSGGHARSGHWPYYLFSTTNTGEPSRYWTDGSSIYWNPRPDDTYTIRYYGFSAASDITAAGTFAYKDIVAFPLASFAVRLLKSGLDDQATDAAQLAQETFSATLDSLDMLQRDGARGFEYTQVHTE